MRRRLLFAFVSLLSALSCVHQPKTAIYSSESNYPDAVAQIFINKCAISGCHNAASAQNAAGLCMDTWEQLLQGGNSGAEIIAFAPKYSPLLYFINTDTSAGAIRATPTMPLSTNGRPMQHLTKDEYNTIEHWIAAGAPDKNGKIPFAENADTRQKIYLVNQGCDLMSVIDAQTNLVMRYTALAQNPYGTEMPHCVKVSPDGAYAYTSFLNGNFIRKMDTRTDKITDSVNVGSLLPGGTGGAWNIVYHSPTSDELMATDWQGNGLATVINTATMTINRAKTTANNLVSPHGIASNLAFDTFFVTAQTGNAIYKFSFKGKLPKLLSLNGLPAAPTRPGATKTPDPHEIMMTPDYSKMFITCESTNEVRVMDAHTDAILDSIKTGAKPQEIAYSMTKPYVFITCTEDEANTRPGAKGSVYVINYNTHEVVKVLYGDFYQPHGIAVDDRYGKIYVASANILGDGPAPHHATACKGNAGWYSVYDLNTLEPVNNKRYQVTIAPYSAAPRFKTP